MSSLQLSTPVKKIEEKDIYSTKEVIVTIFEHEEEGSGEEFELSTPKEVTEERAIKTTKGKVFKRMKTQPIVVERRITQSQVMTPPTSKKSKFELEKEGS